MRKPVFVKTVRRKGRGKPVGMTAAAYDRVRRKGQSASGLTVLEMLITTMLLLMVMTIVSNGAFSVVSVYRRTIEKSDAQILLVQVQAQIAHHLRLADRVNVTERGGTMYINRYRREGVWCCLKSFEPDNSVDRDHSLFRLYGTGEQIDAAREIVSRSATPLPSDVTAESLTNGSHRNLRLSVPDITYDPVRNLFTVQTYTVTRTDTGETLAEMAPFAVAPVNCDLRRES